MKRVVEGKYVVARMQERGQNLPSISFWFYPSLIYIYMLMARHTHPL